MAKTTSTVATENVAQEEGAVKLQELKFTAKIVLDKYENKETGEEIEYVAIKMKHPFDPDEEDLSLAFNTDKYKGTDGKPKKDKVKSLFKKFAKKALQTKEYLEMSGVIRYKTFRDKKERRDINYVSIVCYNIFDNGAAINMYIKNFDAATYFEDFVKKQFDIYVEPIDEDTNLADIP